MKQLSIYRNDEGIVLERENEFGAAFKRFFDSEKGLLEALDVYKSTGELDKYELFITNEYWPLVVKHLSLESEVTQELTHSEKIYKLGEAAAAILKDSNIKPGELTNNMLLDEILDKYEQLGLNKEKEI